MCLVGNLKKSGISKIEKNNESSKNQFHMLIIHLQTLMKKKSGAKE